MSAEVRASLSTMDVVLAGRRVEHFRVEIANMTRDFFTHARQSRACAASPRARQSRAVEAEERNFRTALVAGNLRRLRRDADLTQEQVAAHLGIDRRYVSSWERAEHEPRDPALRSMAKLFGCTFGDFYAEPPVAVEEDAA